MRIVRALVVLVIGGLILAGGAALALAAITPGLYSLRDASSVQITQVYAEAAYYGVMAASCFAAARVLQAAITPTPKREIETMTAMLTQIGKLLTRRD